MTIRNTAAKLALAAIFGLTGLLTAGTASAGDHEQSCFDEIQGKIPWDNGSNTKWERDNVKQLCRGTTQPAEPGKCFATVSSTHVANQVGSGVGKHMDWQSVVSLCSGTNDAAKTATCFNNGLKTGTDWRDVILACQRIL